MFRMRAAEVANVRPSFGGGLDCRRAAELRRVLCQGGQSGPNTSWSAVSSPAPNVTALLWGTTERSDARG